jgi:hypothetical protein
LDIQQQRIERAVSAELAKTGEVITKTGLFDNIDNLYGKKEGEEPAGGATPPPGGEEPMSPLPGGEPMSPPPAETPPPAGVTPESKNKNDLNLILEDTLFNGVDSIDLSKGRSSLIEINDKLKNLLDK